MASTSGGASASPDRSMENNPKTTKQSTPARKANSSSKSGDSPSNAANNGSAGNKPPHTDDSTLLTIASKQSTLMQQLITITCYIPSSSVGAVIGRRGTTIAQIQRQAQQVGTSSGPVRLSIVGHQAEQQQAASGDGTNDPAVATASSGIATSGSGSTGEGPATAMSGTNSASSVPYTYSELDWSSPNWTPVVIRADPCAALTAAQLLRDKAEQLDDVVLDIPLGRSKHAALVGRRGFVLANLSADTNVRIMVPRRELRHDVVQLEGDLANVKHCLARALTIICDATSKQKKAAASAPSNKQQERPQQQQQAASEDKAEVSRSVVTIPIMPTRTMIRKLLIKTATNARKKKVGDNWEVILTGPSDEQVQTAIAMLKKWGDDSSSTDAVPAKDSKNDSNSNSMNNSSSSSNNYNNSGTPSRPRGRGRQQGRNAKGGKGRHNNNKAGKAVEAAANS